jgi:hypothetical protein
VKYISKIKECGITSDQLAKKIADAASAAGRHTFYEELAQGY